VCDLRLFPHYGQVVIGRAKQIVACTACNVKRWLQAVIEARSGSHLSLFAPRRVKDDTAKVGPFEFRVEQREHVVVHGSPGGLGLVAESIVKGVYDLLLEIIPSRMRLDYRLPVSIRYVKVTKSEDVHVDAGCDERHFRLLVPRDARRRVQRDGIPDYVDAF
jgi:hypothetical protein